MTNSTWADVTVNWMKSEDQRLNVGQLVRNEINSAKSARAKRMPRWDNCEELYYSRAPARAYSPYNNAADAHLPITQPKIDALGSLVVGTITSAEPYCRPVPYAPTPQKVLKRKEQIVWAVLKDANIASVLDTVSPIAGTSNAGHTFTYWETDKLCVDVSRPQEVVVWPVANIDSPDDAKLVMRRKWLRKSQVQAKRDLTLAEGGWWSDKEIVSGGDPEDDSNDGSSRREATDGKLITLGQDWAKHESQKLANPANEPDDFLVELYEGTFKAPGKDGRETRYYGIIDFQAGAIQWAVEYDEGMADKFGFKPETGYGYWPRTSVADNLQELQLYCNELSSLIIDGVRMSVFGTVFGNFNGVTGDVRTQPGQIVSDVTLEPGGVVMPTPNLAMALPILQWLVSKADEIARVTIESSGGQAKTNTTATEVQARSAGQSAGVESYIRTFGQGLTSLFARVERILLMYWEEFMVSKVGMMLSLTDEDRAIMELPCRWELVASTPSATPGAQSAYIQSSVIPLLQMPGSGGNPHAILSRILEFGERSGVLDATELQFPQDPQELIVMVATALQMSPDALMEAIGMVQGQQEADQNGQANMDQSMGSGIGAFAGDAGEQPPGLTESGLLSGMGGQGPESAGY